MKNLLFLLLIMSGTICMGQSQHVIAKFIITDARKNDVDVTPNYSANSSYFVFYIVPGEDNPYFGSIFPKSKSQSYGKVYEMNHSSTPETDAAYASETFTFKWSYTNTYDNHEGTASVKLMKVSKPAGIAFELSMIPENLDVLLYKGYMDGSLKTSH